MATRSGSRSRSYSHSRSRSRSVGPDVNLNVIFVIVAVLLLLAAIIFIFTRSSSPNFKNPHEGQVFVYDGNDWVWMTPLESVPVNEMSVDDFSYTNEIPAYTGSDYKVLRGVDVSEHQHDIDWQAVASSGIDYAIIRVARRGTTEGGLYSDPYFKQNLRDARAAGLKVGVYVFSQAINIVEAIEEAELAIELLDGEVLNLPLYFDWEHVESDEGARSDNISQQALTDCAVAFCETVKSAGYKPGVYFNRTLGYYGYDLSRLTDYEFWFSLPDFQYPSFYYASSMWQYSFTAEVRGISTPTDVNLYFIPTNSKTDGN